MRWFGLGSAAISVSYISLTKGRGRGGKELKGERERERECLAFLLGGKYVHVSRTCRAAITALRFHISYYRLFSFGEKLAVQKILAVAVL